MTSLLPTNATPQERALDAAVARIADTTVPIRTLWDPDTCPEALLPWLAWALSVDVWDSDWPDEVKRQVIRVSVGMHRHKGTRAAVADAVSVLGFHVDLSEWWEHGGVPHTFRLVAYGDDVFDAGFSINVSLFQRVSRLIETVKPARSHFDLRIGERFSDAAYLRSATQSAYLHRLDLTPAPRAHHTEDTVIVRSGYRARRVSMHEHVPAARTQHAEVTLGLRSGVRAWRFSRITHLFQVTEGAAYAI